MSAMESMEAIEDEAERFPSQMLLVRDVFTFSYAEAEKISKGFDSNSELMSAITKVAAFLETSDLSEILKEQLRPLLNEEIEVISYSQTARCSVIEM